MSAKVSPVKPAVSDPDLYQATLKYARSNLPKALWQLVNTLIPYCALWALMLYTLRQGYSYSITLALAVVAGGILVRIFILFHDCCHGSFFASRRANTILGYISGVLTFTPFEDWRYAHGVHHATAGDLDRRGLGDIWTMTTEEYRAASPQRRLAYRIYRNPLVLFVPGPALLFLYLQRFSSKGARKRERNSVILTNLSVLAIVIVASLTIGFQDYVWIQLPIILIAGSMGLWLFYVQHQFEGVYWARHDSWDPIKVALEGSSYYKLPSILQWFTGNIGLHHIHHIRANIPNYNLQACFDDIRAFQEVEALTLRTSFKSLRMALYDETQRRMVSFRSLNAGTAG